LEEAQWQSLRRGLELTGLIQVESVPGVTPPFLRFHPTLAPALCEKLPAKERAELIARYQERYYQLSVFLYNQEDKAVVEVREIARRELPNLLAAVDGVLDSRTSSAVDFAENVARFLGFFGLSRDRAALNKRVQAVAPDRGSDDWYRARYLLGEQLFAAGSLREAEAVFTDILAHLNNSASFRRCTVLAQLGRCYEYQGRATHAEAIYRQALAECGQLEPTSGNRRLMGSIHTSLGDALSRTSQYRDARAAYQASLTIKTEVGGDDRGGAVVLFQLGSLALRENKLEEAEALYRQALETFRKLGEPRSEASIWHQLGTIYINANRLEAAEKAFRESARIEEETDNPLGAAQSWVNIAIIMRRLEKPSDAEAWYKKALEVMRAGSHRFEEGTILYNLAILLSSQRRRLSDARAYAEQALVIGKELDPTESEIWKTYRSLAEIADKEGDLEAARGYRREERESYAASPLGRKTLLRLGGLINGLVAAVVDPSKRPASEEVLAKRVEHGWTKLVEALRHILDGERDEDALCEPLDRENSVIVGAVLRGIADSESLKTIPSPEPATGRDTAADLAQRLRNPYRWLRR
jgi:tetratricopeptide (TPR) repeat protein